MPRVCCAGHVNWDVTLYVDRLPGSDEEARIVDQRAAGGGSAANVAVALSGLEIASGLLGAVGNDEYGHLVRRELRQAAVDQAELQVVDAATTVKYLVVSDEGEVAVLGNDGANEALDPDAVTPAYIRSAEHLHLTGQDPTTAATLAELASRGGVTVSFDPGRRMNDRDYSKVIATADLVFVNDNEANTFIADPGDAVDDSTVVVKHGAQGATLYRPDRELSHPGFDIDPVDTSGAGDVFAAGFIASRLSGAGFDCALLVANACGALASRNHGARTAPSREKVESFLADRDVN